MIDLSKFAENFSACMDEKQIKAPALAKFIKTDRSNLTRYKQGKRLPSFPVFIAILEFFNVANAFTTTAIGAGASYTLKEILYIVLPFLMRCFSHMRWMVLNEHASHIYT